MRNKRWRMILCGLILLLVGFLAGSWIAQQQGFEHFNRSFAYLESSDLQRLLGAVRDLRSEEKAVGIAKLDSLMLRKLEGLSQTAGRVVEGYSQDQITGYFQDVYGMAALNADKRIPPELLEAVELAQRPPVIQIEAGAPAPDFELVSFDGKPVGLSDSRGRVVLLTFFAAWCSPCAEELNHLKNHPLIRNGDLDVIAIAVDRKETEAALQGFVRKRELPFTFARDTEDHTVFRQYAPALRFTGEPSFNIPVTVLIGRAGRVIARTQGFSETSFQELLDQVPPALAALPR